MIDNFNFDITSLGDLTAAMTLAFSKHALAEGYVVETCERKTDVTSWGRLPPREQRLVFYWCAPRGRPDYVAFPAKLDAVGAADLAGRWLAAADYGPEPDHDGANTRAWRIYNETWGHVGRDWGAIVAVVPRWGLVGK